MSAGKPVIFTAYANQSENPLQRLSDEDDLIYRILKERGVEKGHFHIHRDSNVSIDKLWQYLREYKDEVVLFHYAGHAESDQIFLQEEDASLEGLARHLGKQKNLRLVFLNGCSTAGQIKTLLESGIPAIIGTHAPVEDELAMRFAQYFYEALVRRATFGEAFEEASQFIRTATKNFEVELYRGASFSNFFQTEEEPATNWGMFVAEGHEAVLGERLPSRSTSVSEVDFEPNKILIDALWEGLARIENFKRQSGDKVKTKVKRKAILSLFPAPVAEHLRKLLVPSLSGAGEENYDNVSLARLKQLVNTYEILMEFLIYTLLAQLWETDVLLQRKKKEEAGKSIEFAKLDLDEETNRAIREFLFVESGERDDFQYITFINHLLNALKSYKSKFFIEELENLSGLTGTDSNFFHANAYLSRLQKRVVDNYDFPGSELWEECIGSEKALAVLFRELGYLARYTLATVKRIDVEKYRHTLEAEFRHVLVRLKDLQGGVDEENETMQRFMDSRSVLLLKEDENENIIDFLNLSPFIIDENAFVDDAELAKIYFFHHYNESRLDWCYRFVYKPNDAELWVGESMFKIIQDQLKAFQKLFN